MRPQPSAEPFRQLIQCNRGIKAIEAGKANAVLERRDAIAASSKTEVIDRISIERQENDLRVFVLPVGSAHRLGECAVDLNALLESIFAPPLINYEEVAARTHHDESSLRELTHAYDGTGSRLTSMC